MPTQKNFRNLESFRPGTPEHEPYCAPLKTIYFSPFYTDHAQSSTSQTGPIKLAQTIGTQGLLGNQVNSLHQNYGMPPNAEFPCE